MLKVLHIIKSADIGGIENLALDFCNNALQHQIEMHLICIGDGVLIPDFKKSPAHFHHFKKISFPYDALDIKLIFKLRKYIKRNNIQVIHSHFADEGLHMLAATIGLKNIIKIQGFAVDLSINRPIDNWKFKFISSRVSANISPSKVLLRQMKNHKINTKNNGYCIPNGIDPKRILQTHSSSLKQELQLPENAIVGGMIGNFYNNVRDQLSICKALPLIIKAYPNFHFVFAGGKQNQWIKENKSYYNQCYTFCKKHNILNQVHFLGLRKDVSNILKNLDFYIHATLYDTFGIAPVEAMFNQIPVFGNDLDIFKEVSHLGKGMCLYQHQNPKDLAQKLINTLNNNSLYKKLSAAHSAFAKKHYHIDIHIDAMKSLYLDLLEKRWGKQSI